MQPPITNFFIDLATPDITVLNNSPFDLAILESGYAGHVISAGLPVPGDPAFVPALPTAQDGRLPVAYLNSSVTDHNRAYWPDDSADWLTPFAADPDDKDAGKPTWSEGDSRVPTWLLNNRGLAFGPDPDGVFGFIVDWTDPEWQARVIAEAEFLVSLGYDGIFLDDVGRYQSSWFELQATLDAYGLQRISRETLAEYAVDMMQFVVSLSAAIKAVDPDAYLLTNSGLDIVAHGFAEGTALESIYYAAVDGFLMETQYAESTDVDDGENYDPWAEAIADYGSRGADLFALEAATSFTGQAEIDAFYQWAATNGIIGLVAPSVDYDQSPQAGFNTPEPDDISGDDSVLGTDQADNLQGGTGNDTVNGQSGNDFIFGGAGLDVLDGAGGDDFLDGGTEADSLLGGEGNDTLQGQLGGDTLTGGAGNDRLIADALADTGDDSVDGGAGDDLLVGRAGMDVLTGGAENDSAYGGSGMDTMEGNDGNDFLSGGIGDDSILGGLGDDTIIGGANRDYIEGGDGADSISGAQQTDTIHGGEGNDTINGVGAFDFLYGGGGDDRITGNRGSDTIEGGQGDDRIFGNEENDHISGDAGRDTLLGNDGTDQLFGGDDVDRLYGGAGDDTMTGGAGSDDFMLEDGFGLDWILDFDALDGGEDINVRGLTNIVDWADMLANHLFDVGADVEIRDGAGNVLTLVGVQYTDMDASDFLF